MPRLSDRDRRVVRAALAFVVVFTVVAMILNVLLPAANNTRRSLWLFGFDTIRIDPNHPTHRQSLGYPAFGQVLAVGNDVYLYDGASGRVGVIRGKTNKEHDIVELHTNFPLHVIEPSPALTFAHGRLWLVTGPGRVRSIDPAHPDRAPHAFVLTASAPGPTRLATVGGDAVATYGSGTTTRVAVLDGSTVARTATIDGMTPNTLIATTADDSHLWLVSRANGVEIDGSTLRVVQRADLGNAVSGGAGAAIAAGNDLWIVARNAPLLNRIDGATGAVTKRIQFARSGLAFRQPTDLVATTTDVWLLAPTTNIPTRHDARVVRVPVASARITLSIDTSSALFVGAIAVT